MLDCRDAISPRIDVRVQSVHTARRVISSIANLVRTRASQTQKSSQKLSFFSWVTASTLGRHIALL